MTKENVVMTNVATLIPAFGLSTQEIDKALAAIPAHFDVPLIIHNDDNEDIDQYLQQLESSGRIQFIRIPFQVGKSEALRQGLIVAMSNSNTEMIVQCDGRSKQPLWQLPILVEALRETKSSMVVGDRYSRQHMDSQAHRTAGAGLMSMIVRTVTDYELLDAVCGMRAYTCELANHFLKLRCFGYGVEVEQLLIASIRGCMVSSVAIESSRQADTTNAEKIEDNLYALVNYATELEMSDLVRITLNHMLAQVKRRMSFDVDLSIFGGHGSARLTYIGSEDNVVDAYADQQVRDGYIASRP